MSFARFLRDAELGYTLTHWEDSQEKKGMTNFKEEVLEDSDVARHRQKGLGQIKGFMRAAIEDGRSGYALRALKARYSFREMRRLKKSEEEGTSGNTTMLEERTSNFWFSPEEMAKDTTVTERSDMRHYLGQIGKQAKEKTDNDTWGAVDKIVKVLKKAEEIASRNR